MAAVAAASRLCCAAAAEHNAVAVVTTPAAPADAVTNLRGVLASVVFGLLYLQAAKAKATQRLVSTYTLYILGSAVTSLVAVGAHMPTQHPLQPPLVRIQSPLSEQEPTRCCLSRHQVEVPCTPTCSPPPFILPGHPPAAATAVARNGVAGTSATAAAHTTGLNR